MYSPFSDHINEPKVTVILLSVLIFIPILIVALVRAAQLFKMSLGLWFLLCVLQNEL